VQTSGDAGLVLNIQTDNIYITTAALTDNIMGVLDEIYPLKRSSVRTKYRRFVNNDMWLLMSKREMPRKAISQRTGSKVPLRTM